MSRFVEEMGVINQLNDKLNSKSIKFLLLQNKVRRATVCDLVLKFLSFGSQLNLMEELKKFPFISVEAKQKIFDLFGLAVQAHSQAKRKRQDHIIREFLEELDKQLI